MRLRSYVPCGCSSHSYVHHTPLKKCAMTHSNVCRDSSICLPWVVHICVLAQSYIRSCAPRGCSSHSYACHASFTFVMTHSHVCHASFIRVPCLIHTCAMTHSYVCHDASISAPWCIHMCAMNRSCIRWRDPRSCSSLSYVCHESRLFHICSMTRSYCVPCIMHMCAMTHSYVCHDSLIRVQWLIHMCARTHWRVCHDSTIQKVKQS